MKSETQNSRLETWLPRIACCLAIVLLWVWTAPVVHADGCTDPANLTYNCDFDKFVPVPKRPWVVPEGWWPFVEHGSPAIDQSQDSASPPAQRIWSNGLPFTAGIYQTVNGLIPGATYEAVLFWAPYSSNGDDSIERKIGIDPAGGTDPRSPTVVWGPGLWRFKRLTSADLRAQAVAQSDTVTVFVRVHNPISHGADQVFVDGVTLVKIADPAPATATPTPLPPSSTPVPPTDTPSPTASLTASPTPSPTASSTATATATYTATPTATVTPSPTPSVTPSPTATPAPAILAVAEGRFLSFLLALGAVAGMLFLFTGRGRRSR